MTAAGKEKRLRGLPRTPKWVITLPLLRKLCSAGIRRSIESCLANVIGSWGGRQTFGQDHLRKEGTEEERMRGI